MAFSSPSKRSTENGSDNVSDGNNVAVEQYLTKKNTKFTVF